MDLKSKLNTAKNMSSDSQTASRCVERSSVSTFVGNVDDLTESVFGSKLIEDGSGAQVYDPNAELKMLQSGIPKDKLASSKLPQAIKEAIASNPLTVTSVDPKMDAFTNKLAMLSGMKNTTDLMDRLDERDEEKENAKKAVLNENAQYSTQSIDYSLIKTIVENAVNSLKSELKSELNESISHGKGNDSSLKVMKMADKFLFLDSDNNIYECQMVYKGKNKSKK